MNQYIIQILDDKTHEWSDIPDEKYDSLSRAIDNLKLKNICFHCRVMELWNFSPNAIITLDNDKVIRDTNLYGE